MPTTITDRRSGRTVPPPTTTPSRAYGLLAPMYGKIGTGKRRPHWAALPGWRNPTTPGERRQVALYKRRGARLVGQRQRLRQRMRARRSARRR
jgi:hypothetical protein